MVTVAQEDLRRIWALFADLLEYPYESPEVTLEECRTLTTELFPGAGARVSSFQDSVGAWTLGRLQEEYTRAFDLDETHSLYVGYHLLGESYKRSALLLELKQRYAAHGLEVAGELADHLPVVLRFLGICEDPELSEEILVEAVWSMLEVIGRRDSKALEPGEAEEDRPPVVAPHYHQLLAALLDVVQTVTKGDRRPLVIASVSPRPPGE